MSNPAISQDLQEYFERLIEPLAKSFEINKLLERLKDQEKKIIDLQEVNENQKQKNRDFRKFCYS